METFTPEFLRPTLQAMILAGMALAFAVRYSQCIFDLTGDADRPVENATGRVAFLVPDSEELSLAGKEMQRISLSPEEENGALTLGEMGLLEKLAATSQRPERRLL